MENRYTACTGEVWHLTPIITRILEDAGRIVKDEELSTENVTWWKAGPNDGK